MARKALSQQTVDRLNPDPKRTIERPDHLYPALRLIVQPTGSRAFAIRTRINAKPVKITLKDVGLDLAKARQKTREILEAIAKGQDPRAARLERKERARDTVAVWVAKYIERRLKPRNRTWRPIQQIFERDVLPRWGERPITAITKRDVLTMLDEIIDRGAPVAANRTLAHLAPFSKWLVEREVLDVDFCVGIKMPAPERSRTRRLSHDEIKPVWRAWDFMGYPFGMIGQLALLTLQRRGEVAAMRRSAVDFRRWVWVLEATDTKTSEEHVLPLSDAVIKILAAIPQVDGSDLFFPAARASSNRPVSGFSKALARAIDLSGVKDWTWHDLRRTGRSELARLGVTSAVGERILNHSAGGSEVEKIYDRHSYLPEMRAALDLWAAEVERIVTGGDQAKIVPMRQIASA
jgi:integrase